MKLVAYFVFIVLNILRVDSKTYNILSFDSCLYKGYMTAKFIDYLEQRAYMIAKN